jgi:hypothetical protein
MRFNGQAIFSRSFLRNTLPENKAQAWLKAE